MPSILTFPETNPRPKIHLSTGCIPGYISPKQPPTKNPPFQQILSSPFLQQITLVVPSTLYDQINSKLFPELSGTTYSKVFLRLQDVLSGDFFTEYIKTGNILMISEGSPGVDPTFFLNEGVLSMDLPKEVYERTGLQGKSVRSGSRKHEKMWYRIEIDLRQPSMLHGKKGFERVLWAAKNVLNRSLCWLFVDLTKETKNGVVSGEKQQEGGKATRPIEKHHPQACGVGPRIEEVRGVAVPSSILRGASMENNISKEEQEETYHELQEWIDLVCSQSPCITNESKIDHNISRYTTPGVDPAASPQNLTVIRWEGLISSAWMTQFLISTVRHLKSVSSPQWLAISAVAHQTQAIGQIDGYSIILNSHDSIPQLSTNTDKTTGQKRSVEEIDLSNESTAKTVQYVCLEHVDSVT